MSGTLTLIDLARAVALLIWGVGPPHPALSPPAGGVRGEKGGPSRAHFAVKV